MADQVFHVEHLHELHQYMGLEKPMHPLISVIDVRQFNAPRELIGMRGSTGLYMVACKDSSCAANYGRNVYDFQEGVLSFSAPHQVFTLTDDNRPTKGWMLLFHPDLLRQSPVFQRMDRYSFFGYDVHEALHLSTKEETLLDSLVEQIQEEYRHNIDGHTREIFVSQIELLLNYCLRFYERQFHTRKNHNVDVVSRVRHLLKEYYDEGQQMKSGIPSVQYLADGVHLSANYLSDLLKRETGKNSTEMINHFVVDRAKTMLVQAGRQISEVAYDLGFNYPHYFSRVFKRSTGLTPKDYRDQYLN